MIKYTSAGDSLISAEYYLIDYGGSERYTNTMSYNAHIKKKQFNGNVALSSCYQQELYSRIYYIVLTTL